MCSYVRLHLKLRKRRGCTTSNIRGDNTIPSMHCQIEPGKSDQKAQITHASKMVQSSLRSDEFEPATDIRSREAHAPKSEYTERSTLLVIFSDLSIRIALLMKFPYNAFQNFDYVPYAEDCLEYGLMVAKGFY